MRQRVGGGGVSTVVSTAGSAKGRSARMKAAVQGLEEEESEEEGEGGRGEGAEADGGAGGEYWLFGGGGGKEDKGGGGGGHEVFLSGELNKKILQMHHF